MTRQVIIPTCYDSNNDKYTFHLNGEKNVSKTLEDVREYVRKNIAEGDIDYFSKYSNASKECSIIENHIKNNIEYSGCVSVKVYVDLD